MGTQRLPQASKALDNIRKFWKDVTTHGAALLFGHRENRQRQTGILAAHRDSLNGQALSVQPHSSKSVMIVHVKTCDCDARSKPDRTQVARASSLTLPPVQG
ncbi:hypothetical protein KCU95_g6, partial [Aureobasidium melanogenum]